MSTTDRNIQGRGAGSMTMDRLREVFESYGASAERWPAAERGAMLALLNSSAEARAVRDSAYALDRVLDRLESPPPSAELEAAVSAMRPGAPRQRTGSRNRRLPALARPAALAASVLIGVFIGFGVGNYEPEPAAERQTVQTLPTAETAAPAPVADAAVQGPPAAPSIATGDPASSGFGTAPLLAGSDAPVEESESPVPLI